MRDPPTPTARLYWVDPTRKTALATVTGHVRGGFTLDRTVFHAPLPGYHHKQPEDRGHVLAEGHKLKLARTSVDEQGRLVHRTEGPLPAVGAKAQLHLDAPRRSLQARAHLAMHLLVAAIATERATLVEPPAVVGGGEVRLHATGLRGEPREAIAAIHRRVAAAAAERALVEASFAPRDEAARRVTHHVVALGAVMPEEPTLRLVRAGDGCVLPCDAPLPERTSDVGALVVAHMSVRKDGTRWGARLVDR